MDRLNGAKQESVGWSKSGNIRKVGNSPKLDVQGDREQKKPESSFSNFRNTNSVRNTEDSKCSGPQMFTNSGVNRLRDNGQAKPAAKDEKPSIKRGGF